MSALSCHWERKVGSEGAEGRGRPRRTTKKRRTRRKKRRTMMKEEEEKVRRTKSGDVRWWEKMCKFQTNKEE